MAWLTTAQKALKQGKYKTVATLYEEQIKQQPDEISHYWYLGLAYLLQAQEANAQEVWISVLTQGDPDKFQQWTKELLTILETEATRQEKSRKYSNIELIRWQIYQLDPSDINNALEIMLLAFKRNRFNPELIEELGLIEAIKEADSNTIDSKKLQTVLLKTLPFATVATVELIEASLPHITQPQAFADAVLKSAIEMAYDYHKPTYSADLIKLCLKLNSDDPYLLNELLTFYQLSKNATEILATARQFYNSFEKSCHTTLLKLYVTYRVLLSFSSYGAWLELDATIKSYYQLFAQLLQESESEIDPFLENRLLSIAMPLPYLADKIPENRHYTNKLAQLFQQNSINRFKVPKYPFKSVIKNPNKTLRIGYIAHTLKKHSVGWLSRWLFHYHHSENFEIFLYLVNQPEDELTQNWFRKNAKKTYNFSRDPQEIFNRIRNDKIDILIDLDSITHNITYQVLALKPAPIQVSWLGFDATGLPAVDYFVVDDYVVPQNAQDYYQETLWRLPQTYLAVENFEVGKQTRFRQDLGINDDAVIYLTVQNQQKLNPNTLKLQLKIIANVSNSYLLMKLPKDSQYIQPLCFQLAQEQGIESDRLRFLDKDPDEQTHRANLQIADIVLDTYPYNGATTTLEVLWMGIPLVTWVGQQFSARNSYGFMMNVGLKEGIAWTAEEYVQWGIDLGKNADLRLAIRQKLQQSHHTAPLWNARQFTQEMEKAYQQMWEQYCQSS